MKGQGVTLNRALIYPGKAEAEQYELGWRLGVKTGQLSGDEGEGHDQVHIAHQTALRFPV